MFANRKSERACQAMLYSGVGVCAVTLVMLPAVLLGGRGEGAELWLRLLAYAVIAGACGIFAWIGYLGVRPVTSKYYRLGCFVLVMGLLLQFLSGALLYLRVTGGLASAYLLGSMLICLLGTVFMLYVGADAGAGFYQRRNDGKILLFLLVVSTVLSLLPLLLLGSPDSPFVSLEAVGLLLTGILRFGLPACYVLLVDRIRDPFSDEEVAEDRKQRRELKQQAREAARQKRLQKLEERKKRKEARAQKKEAEKKAKEEAARKKAEEARRKAEAARLAAEEAARRAEEEKRAEEARRKEEAARLAAEAARKEQEKAEEDAKTKAQRLAAAEAGRLAPEIFGCTLEEWKKGKKSAAIKARKSGW